VHVRGEDVLLFGEGTEDVCHGYYADKSAVVEDGELGQAVFFKEMEGVEYALVFVNCYCFPAEYFFNTHGMALRMSCSVIMPASFSLSMTGNAPIFRREDMRASPSRLLSGVVVATLVVII